MEHKAVPFILEKADPEGRTFEGYASVFRSLDGDEPDMTGDMVCAGAFKKSITERGRKVRLLWQHDSSMPLGRWMEMREDAKGLYVKGQLSDTSLGRDVMALLRDGAIDSMSIGYEPIGAATEFAKTRKGDTVRLLKEVKLWEVSLVTFPADEKARVLAVKAEEPVAPARAAEPPLPADVALDSAIIALEIKAGRRLSARSQQSIRAAIEALKELLGEAEAELEADGCTAKPDEEDMPHKPMKAAPEPEAPAATEIDSDSQHQGEPGAVPPTALETKAAGSDTTPQASEYETQLAQFDAELEEFERTWRRSDGN